MDYVIEALLIAAAVAPLVLLALLASRGRVHGLGALFLALLVLDSVLNTLPYSLSLHPPGLQWNWAGKVLSIAWALAFVRFGPLDAGDVGLTLRQRPGSVIPATVLTMVLIAAAVVLSGGDGTRIAAETVAYQATMPGFAEELVVRGVFLALLARAFGGALPRADGRLAAEGAPEASRAPRVWAVAVTAAAFGLAHALGYRNGAFSFDVGSFVLPSIGGVAFAWLRIRTGSLLFPILAHNGANLISIFAG